MDSSALNVRNKQLVDHSSTESRPSLDASFNQSYLPLLDCSRKEKEETDCVDSTSVPHNLQSYLTAMMMETPSIVDCRPIRKDQIKTRLMQTLESEKTEEEKRKARIIMSVLKRGKMHRSVFRRFSPRRVTLKRGATFHPLKRQDGTLKSIRPAHTRHNATLMSDLLCFKPM